MAETRHDHQAHQHGNPGQGEGQLRVGILTCSDRGARGERADVSGPTIHNLVVERLGGKVAQYKVVPDDRAQIEQTLTEWVDQERLDLIFTTGGTGFSPRDVTPEATRAVVERETPALTQAMLFESLRITPYAMLTRATAGIRRRTLIVNLPGNPKAVNENFDAIAEVLPHAVDIAHGVDTHAQRAGHAAHGAHGSGDQSGGRHEAGHATHDTHAGHAEHERHGAQASHEERRHEGHDGDGAPDGHARHTSPHAAEPSALTEPAKTGGIARNVGGPTC